MQVVVCCKYQSLDYKYTPFALSCQCQSLCNLLALIKTRIRKIIKIKIIKKDYLLD
jgi:hypothetical protein